MEIVILQYTGFYIFSTRPGKFHEIPRRFPKIK